MVVFATVCAGPIRAICTGLPQAHLPQERKLSYCLVTVGLASIEGSKVSASWTVGVSRWVNLAAGEWHAFQTRRVQSFRLADLQGIVKPFVNGPRPFDVSRLVIITSCTRVSAKTQEEIYKYSRIYPQLTIDRVWDGGELSRRLRRLP